MHATPIPGPAASRATAYELGPIRPCCPECGYDLRATVTATGATCGECGTHLAFDRLDFPVRRPRVPVLRVAWQGLIVAVAISAVTLCAAAIVLGSPLVRSIVATAVAIVTGAILARIAWPRLSRKRCAAVATSLAIAWWVATPVQFAVVLAFIPALAFARAACCGTPRGIAGMFDAVLLPALNIFLFGERAVGVVAPRGRRLLEMLGVR